jgi:DNA-binding winged helix-turn-helix (wHTH) protein/TolB-like protein
MSLKQTTYQFDEFRLEVSNRQLLRDGIPVTLPAKAFDMLVALIESGERLVSKDELFSRVWPDQIVEESNLTVQVSAIRKALGDRTTNPKYLMTVPGHGYRFIGAVKRFQEEEEVVIERHSVARIESGADAIVNLSAVRDFTRRGSVASIRGHLPVLISLVIFLGAAGIFFLWKRSRSHEHPRIKSIAVLPFKPLAAANRDESLELGMADTLITRLGSIKSLLVRPTSAVRRYSGLEQDAIAAGRELQVDSVVDGTLERDGERLRVTVRLIRTIDGVTLWNESFDQNFTNILAVQDRCAERVADVLASRLGEQEQRHLTKRYTRNPDAYRLYAMGRYFWSKMTVEGFNKSIEYYNEAIKLDHDYALAYAGLADSHNFLGSFGRIPVSESHPRAREAAERALALDEQLAEAHTSLAAIIMDYYWDWSEAERHFARAIELNDNYALAHHLYSQYLSLNQRFDQSIAEAKKAQEIDPLSVNESNNVALALYRARRYDESIKAAKETLEMDKAFAPAHINLGFAYLEKGMNSEAIEEFKEGRTLTHDSPQLIAMLGYSYARAGMTIEARTILKQLEQRSRKEYVSPFDIAGIHIGLGDKDTAFLWLERSYNERSWLLSYIKVEPLFDPLRSDPRFINLTRRVGF